MALTFDVDGKNLTEPTSNDIVTGFSSIDPKIRAISIVFLGDDSLMLWAFGHPQEGYTLEINKCLEPKSPRCTRTVTSPDQPIPHDKIISVFQDFLRGDTSWQNKFQWTDLGIEENSIAHILKRIAVIILLFALLCFVFQLISKHI